MRFRRREECLCLSGRKEQEGGDIFGMRGGSYFVPFSK
jgi:hypothetical protein